LYRMTATAAEPKSTGFWKQNGYRPWFRFWADSRDKTVVEAQQGHRRKLAPHLQMSGTEETASVEAPC